MKKNFLIQGFIILYIFNNQSFFIGAQINRQNRFYSNKNNQNQIIITDKNSSDIQQANNQVYKPITPEEFYNSLNFLMKDFYKLGLLEYDLEKSKKYSIKKKGKLFIIGTILISILLLLIVVWYTR